MRHAKVQECVNPLTRFGKILFWEVIRKTIGAEKNENDEIMGDYTQQQILEIVEKMEKIIDVTAQHIFVFRKA